MSHATEPQSARKRFGQLLLLVALGTANAVAGTVEQTERRIRREAAKGTSRSRPRPTPIRHSNRPVRDLTEVMNEGVSLSSAITSCGRED
jgi:hypothetical protein